MTTPEAPGNPGPDSSREQIEGNTQLALRFTPIPIPMLRLHELPIDSRLLELPLALLTFRKFADFRPFVTLDSRAPVPNPEIAEKFNFKVFPVSGCGVDGSDRALANLDLSLSYISYVPELNAQDGYQKRKGKLIHPFTMGHEILLDGFSVYPLLDDLALGNQPCPNCQRAQENHCQRFGKPGGEQGNVRGFALGYGAFLVNQEGQLLTELGGGLSYKVAVNETQLYPHNLPLKRAAFIDTYACVLESLDGIVGEGQAIDPTTTPDIPAIIIGFGPVGLTAADALSQKGFNMQNVVVLAKYPKQEEVAKEYGCKVVNVQDEDHLKQLAEHINAKLVRQGGKIWIDGGTPLVIDAIGNQESVDLASHFVRDGYAILVGLPQEFVVDLNRFNLRAARPHLTWWASRKFYPEAINLLEQSPFGGWEEITKAHPLEDAFNALQSNKVDKQQFIKHLVVQNR